MSAETARETAREAARLVRRIIIRRRLRCIRERTHSIGYCKVCGVHQ